MGRSGFAAVLVLALLGLCGDALGQDTRFRWRPLTLEDFRAPVPGRDKRMERAEVQLVIEKQIAFRINRDGRIAVTNVGFTALFDPARAWFDRTGLPPDAEAAVLRHEQGHFDIIEINVREMTANAGRIAREIETTINDDPARRRQLAALIDESAPAETQRSLSRQRMAMLEAASATLQRLLVQEEAVQERYEAETGHGIEAERQAEWDAWIRERLRNPPAPQN